VSLLSGVLREGVYIKMEGGKKSQMVGKMAPGDKRFSSRCWPSSSAGEKEEEVTV